MLRNIIKLLAVVITWAALASVASADNLCWNGADYHTVASGGHEDSAVVWGTSGILGSGGTVHYCQSVVTNNSGSTVWAMVFNAVTLPANGAKPNEEYPVTSVATNSRFGYATQPWNGVVIACSSTEGTLTVTAAAACNFHVTISR